MPKRRGRGASPTSNTASASSRRRRKTLESEPINLADCSTGVTTRNTILDPNDKIQEAMRRGQELLRTMPSPPEKPLTNFQKRWYQDSSDIHKMLDEYVRSTSKTFIVNNRYNLSMLYSEHRITLVARKKSLWRKTLYYPIVYFCVCQQYLEREPIKWKSEEELWDELEKKYDLTAHFFMHAVAFPSTLAGTPDTIFGKKRNDKMLRVGIKPGSNFYYSDNPREIFDKMLFFTGALLSLFEQGFTDRVNVPLNETTDHLEWWGIVRHK